MSDYERASILALTVIAFAILSVFGVPQHVIEVIMHALVVR